MKGKVYVPWYDNQNIEWVMQRHSLSRSDAIDWLWVFTPRSEKMRIRSAMRHVNGR